METYLPHFSYYGHDIMHGSEGMGVVGGGGIIKILKEGQFNGRLNLKRNP